MKLSDAIRLGAMLHPQCKGHEAERDPGTWAVVATCAMGAAYEAGYSRRDEWIYAQASCPVCGREGYRFDIVEHLNDRHGWTRERIADWVATLEEPIAEPAPVLVGA